MKTVLFAGYPKTGNTLLGESFVFAGKKYDPEWDLGNYKHLSEIYDYYIIPHSGLSVKVNPLCNSICLKTHERPSRYHNLINSFYGGVSHVITITRNPFEVLLSSLNYFRYVFKKNKTLNHLEIKALNLLLPDYEINEETFLDDFTLDNLREKQLLDVALTNFNRNGTSLYNFHAMSGPWCSYTNTYNKHHNIKSGEIAILNLRYEDLVQNYDLCSEKLGNFLNCDPSYIKYGFEQQKKLAEERKNNGDLFFNKMESGYWKEYFTPSVCRDFISTYSSELEDLGYDELINHFYW